MHEIIEGVINNIIFEAGNDGYRVMELTANDELVVVVGYFHDVKVGTNIRINGEYVEHLRYGRQFKAVSYEVTLPKGSDAIRNYLATGVISGIRGALATRIVNKFGEKSLEIMENSPEELSSISGISLKKAKEISEKMQEDKRKRHAIMFLLDYGISANMALKLYDYYSDRIYEVISENPYKLAEDVQGIGFRIADNIAQNKGISKYADVRIKSGILYALNIAVNNGNVYLPMDELIKSVQELLEIDVENIEPLLTALVVENKLYIKLKENEKNVYLLGLYNAENNIAYKLVRLNIFDDIDEEQCLKDIKEIERLEGMQADDIQRSAIIKALKSRLMIITGGPGTGKTTVLKTIIRLLESRGLSIVLTAPTGRAAKRMSEATGKDAMTIHRLLDFRAGEDDNTLKFNRNSDYPIEADVVIVDEMSMVDVFLMNSLLNAIPIGCRLILTGDADQLPSVGPGNVLKDIIESNQFSMVILDKVFRHNALSNIATVAHNVNKGIVLEPKSLAADFIFIRNDDISSLQKTILTMLLNVIPTKLNIDSFDIQVLCPMKRGPVGVEEMNVLLQKYMNPPSFDKQELKKDNSIYRVGDKVMQIKNNYQLTWEIKSKSGFVADEGCGVYNGDIGRIKNIDNYARTITVHFDDDKQVEYPFNLLNELELAYAITIHKSQGSEYRSVVLPLFNINKLLMTRNILYTAITRAKTNVSILGKPEVFKYMIENIGETRRYSSLSDYIKESKEILG